MAKGPKKANKRRRRGAPHPMSAGQREPSGRLQRETTVTAREARIDPTPQLVAKLKRHGPTDMIQRAVQAKVITEDEARGLEAFAGIRRTIGVAEYSPAGVLGRLAPQAPVCEQDETRLRAALDAYRDACAALDRHKGAHDACVTICDNRIPHNVGAMKRGAEALCQLFIRGQKAA